MNYGLTASTRSARQRRIKEDQEKKSQVGPKLQIKHLFQNEFSNLVASTRGQKEAYNVLTHVCALRVVHV